MWGGNIGFQIPRSNLSHFFNFVIMSTKSYNAQHIDSQAFLFDLGAFSKTQKKWRLAFIVEYSCRVLVSLSGEIIANRENQVAPTILRVPSHIILDIQLNGDDGSTQQGGFSNIDKKCLTGIVEKKNLDSLARSGGVKGVSKALQTNEELGVCNDADDIESRRHAFGSNTYQKPPTKGFFHFVLQAFKDIIFFILFATISLGIGIKEHGPKKGWHEGGSILVAVFLFVIVSAVSNLRQLRHFEKLSSDRNNIQVDVMRGGRRQQISIFEVVVGDIVCLKIGDQIPADGLFLDGYSLQIDESSMTGESEHVQVDSSNNPFLVSGCMVVDGYGRMLVTSVGMNTKWGEKMSSRNHNSIERTTLQVRFNKLTSLIAKVSLAVSFVVLVALLVRHLARNTKHENGNQVFNDSKIKINDVLKVVCWLSHSAVVRIGSAVTIAVVALWAGLPLDVMITFTYSTKRMMADHVMVRNFSACETMGSVTTICIDKTTMNQMKVTNFWLGQEALKNDTSSSISPTVLELLYQGVGLNTIDSVYKPTSGAVPEFSGSPTEKAILSWALLELGMDMDELKKSYTILVKKLNSEKKRSGVSMKKMGEEKIHVHWKGAAEVILEMCSNYYESTGTMKTMGEDERMKFNQIIQDMAANSLRCIAFAHKQIPKEEPEEEGLTLLGLVGLNDACRSEAKDAMKACTKAGVNIKMITGDNIFTARAMAIECGIIGPNHDMDSGEVVEGMEFQNYKVEERLDKIDGIRVMARSSPFDKLLMVQCLKQKGHVIAVTGDGTNDAPALKEADIGLSLGIQGTDIIKESSDIVILDDNFASVVTILRWGRCVNNNIQKFIQFQISGNIAALVINFVAAVFDGEVPLSAVQLLWVNLIMDTLGALALATEPPTEELMEKPPVGRTEPLITNVMCRNILAQTFYQIAVLLILQFKGETIFNVSEKAKDTLILNTFVLCQIFNEFNARKIERKNVFKGIFRNRWFLGIVGVTLILQMMMVEFLKKFADTERLNWEQWAACIGIAAVSWPIGWVFKCIPVPDKPFLDFLKW